MYDYAKWRRELTEWCQHVRDQPNGTEWHSLHSLLQELDKVEVGDIVQTGGMKGEWKVIAVTGTSVVAISTWGSFRFTEFVLAPVRRGSSLNDALHACQLAERSWKPPTRTDR